MTFAVSDLSHVQKMSHFFVQEDEPCTEDEP